MPGYWDAHSDRDWQDACGMYGEIDPRDPDPSRQPPFDYHNCYRCRDGQKPCVHGNPGGCEFLHARND